MQVKSIIYSFSVLEDQFLENEAILPPNQEENNILSLNNGVNSITTDITDTNSQINNESLHPISNTTNNNSEDQSTILKEGIK